MYALYAFCRVTDDLADAPGDPAAKQFALAAWRAALPDALAGKYSHAIHPALHRTAVDFAIPHAELDAVIDGAMSDLETVRIETFPQLESYCYRVAGVVGRMCVRIWGTRRDGDLAEALSLAVHAGTAFQLTNVLRDLGEDLAAGRIYLPAEDLTKFGTPPDTWRDPARRADVRTMLAFQAERARAYYVRADPLADLLEPDGRAVYRAMSGLYARLLTEIERRGFDVFTSRVRLGNLAKLRIMIGAYLRKFA